MASTFGGFTIARLGMIAGQKALDLTGHNISNINTAGYTRQRVDQYSFFSGGANLYRSSNSSNVGTGVMISSISQLRDPYLDIRFRKEMSSVGSADSKLSALEQLSSVLDEVSKKGLLDQFSDLASRLEDLNTENASSEEFETLVRSSAKALCDLLNTYSKNLDTVQDNIAIGLEQDISTVDTLISDIQKLNVQIYHGDVNGDASLELRDQRNQLIDDLSQYMKIDVSYGLEDVGAGVKVEKMTIKLVDPDTNKPGKTLIDGQERAKVSLIKDAGLADKYLIELSELADANGKQTSDVASIFRTGSLKLSETASGSHTVQVSYTLPDGSDATKDVTFAVDADKDVTLQNMFDALSNDTDLTALFTIEKGKSTVGFTSKQTGADAPTITGLEITSNADPDNPDVTIGKGMLVQKAVASNAAMLGDDVKTYGALQSSQDMLTRAGEYTVDGGDKSARGVQYYRSALDSLANKFATEMNKINSMNPNGEVFAPEKNGGALFEADGGGTITASNIKISDGWKSGAVDLVAAFEDDPPSMSNTNASRFLELMTHKFDFRPTDILRMPDTAFESGALTQDPSVTSGNYTAVVSYLDENNMPHKVEVSFAAGTSAGDTASNLLAALAGKQELADFGISALGATGATGADGIKFDAREPFAGLVSGVSFTKTDANGEQAATEDISLGIGKITGSAGSDTMFSGTLVELLTNTQAVLGEDVKITSTVLETYTNSAEEINISRDSVSGVDLNEEGTNLMQYQKSFAAACRVMTALDEALDKVINGMGVVGR